MYSCTHHWISPWALGLTGSCLWESSHITSPGCRWWFGVAYMFVWDPSDPVLGTPSAGLRVRLCSERILGFRRSCVLWFGGLSHTFRIVEASCIWLLCGDSPSSWTTVWFGSVACIFWPCGFCVPYNLSWKTKRSELPHLSNYATCDPPRIWIFRYCQR